MAREMLSRRRVLSSLGVGAVMCLSGVLFTTSARLSAGGSIRDDSGGVVEALRQRDRRIQRLTEDAQTKREQIDELSQGAVHGEDEERTRLAEQQVGLLPVHGPGLEVTLSDAPQGVLGTLPDLGPDDLVVHQQDLEGFVNGLWAGGAEAMMLQGQRIIAGTSFRCAGNTLLLEGRVYSPPFVITAVGNPSRMRSALDTEPRVTVYRQWVSYVGLGETVKTLDDVELPGFDGSLTLTTAKAG